MYNNRLELHVPLTVLDYTARIGSVASITFLLVLFAAEGLHPSEISTNEWAGLIFFPIGIVIGMAIAWWKEGLGSMITLGSLLGFYVVWGYLLRNHIGGWWFIVLSAPGFLFLLHWLLRDFEKRPVMG
ncbi:MAG TPA: hypothetical protein VFS76_26365 [Pyrinomonadaceae bacterium]|nr:hypothetical protein [Pyrinomonadaceae bacterium]